MNPGPLLVVYLLAVLAFIGLERRRLATIVTRAGRPAVYFVTLAVWATLIAQTYLPGRALYPFASWTMYSGSTPFRQSWRIEFVRSSGSHEVIPIARIARGPNPRPLMARITGMARRLAHASDENLAEQQAELEAVLEALATLDHRRANEDPVAQIRVEECTIEGDPPWDRTSITCEPFFEYDVAETTGELRIAGRSATTHGGRDAP